MNSAASSYGGATPSMVLWQATRLPRAASALALFAAAMWFVWLGWDQEYYLVDGVPQGPYRPWQVLGCGLSIATAAVVAYLRVPQLAAVFVLPVAALLGIAFPWSVDASSDDSGMWVVGLVFLVVGGGFGLALLLTVTRAVTGSGSSSTRDLVVCCVLTVLAFVAFAPLALVPLAGAAWILFTRWLPEQRRAKLESGAP